MGLRFERLLKLLLEGFILHLQEGLLELVGIFVVLQSQIELLHVLAHSQLVDVECSQEVHCLDGVTGSQEQQSSAPHSRVIPLVYESVQAHRQEGCVGQEPGEEGKRLWIAFSEEEVGLLGERSDGNVGLPLS